MATEVGASSGYFHNSLILDTCKFLHDRSDYKSGWQIDKEWEEAQRKKQQKLIRAKLEGKTDGESLNSGSSSSDESN